MPQIWVKENCEFVRQNFGKIELEEIREHIQKEIFQRYKTKDTIWVPCVTSGGVIWKACEYGLITLNERDQLMKKNSYERIKISRGGSFSEKVKQQALERSGYKCERCGSTEKLEVDHVKELWKSEIKDHSLDNAQVLCKKCNMKKYIKTKKDKTIERFEIEKFKKKGNRRNLTCPCGSGIKFKKCCWDKYDD